MLDNYHKWDQVSSFPKTPPLPGGRLCLHLRNDPWLRKRGFPIFPFLLPSRSSMTWSTACSTTEPWNNIHRLREHLSWYLLTQHQQDGPCKGEDTDAVTHIKTMDDIKGDWWAAKYLEKKPKKCSIYTGGCCGVSTVARHPTLVATTGTHASMNDSYSRWPWWWWQTRLTINMLNQHMCIHYAMSGEEKVAGQRSVDQQCDLLWRQARQMRHQHNCHHCKCVNASSRGELGLTIKKV